MSPRVDWYYRRNNCQSCAKSDCYLEEADVAIEEKLDARKQRIGPAEALRMARAVDQLWVARGKSFQYFDMKKDRPSDAELKKLLIGPSGNLRAPTIRHGKRMVVGFNPEAYELGLSGSKPGPSEAKRTTKK